MVTAVICNDESERARDARLRIRLMDTAEPPQPLPQGAHERDGGVGCECAYV